MSSPQLVLPALLVVTLVAQALRPGWRLLIVTAGAALSCAVATLTGTASTTALFADVPWDVIVMLVALGLMSQIFVATRVFGMLAVASARRSGGRPRTLVVLFALVMYGVSGLVNNLTALLLVLPVLLILLRLMAVSQRYVSWTLGIVLVACNLGGAATPIGDFPAILLLGRGSMTFPGYLTAAAPPTLLALLLILAVLALVRPERTVQQSAVARRLSLAVVAALYRNTRLDWRLFGPISALMLAMLVAWMVVPAQRMGPELICWLGVGLALALRPRAGEQLLRSRVDVEAVLFLLSLFVMVAAVRRSGLFEQLIRGLEGLPIGAGGQLLVFLLLAGVLTGLFSAGPSMAALLDVAESLAQRVPPTAVYVGLALSVCAGSSLLLTAATSGPMAQILVERAELRDPEGARLHFGFLDFLPVGLLCFAVIQTVALAYALAVLVLA
ncbi:MAG: permease [Deltaproteobacteria bacterium]|nr:permease [Deltaproteobacteria bacterium]